MTETIYAQPKTAADLSECYFYHTMELPGHGVVEGQWDLRGEFGEYTNFCDFAGKRVLDIGAGSGFLSFAAEAAGAAEVVSFDMDVSERQDFLPFQGHIRYQDPAAFRVRHNARIAQWHKAYWVSHAALGSQAKAYYGDVYALPEALGRFDITIVGSILEHLADPIKALTSISRRTDTTMIIVTPMLETDEPIARFLGNSDKPAKDFVFWMYSRGVYRHVLAMLGFEIVEIQKRGFRFVVDGGNRHDRFVLTCRRMDADNAG